MDWNTIGSIILGAVALMAMGHVFYRAAGDQLPVVLPMRSAKHQETAVVHDAVGGTMVALTNTRAKVDEARFFLGHLQKYRSAATSGNPRKPERQAFGYYVSAFVSAARSVTWVLQAEEKEKYDAWIGGWEERRLSWAEANSVNIDRLLELTNEMRLDAVHREGKVKTRIETEWVPITEPSRENNRYQINILSLSLTPEEGAFRTSSEIQYIEGTDKEVVKLCELYVSYLEALLIDFDQEHSAA